MKRIGYGFGLLLLLLAAASLVAQLLSLLAHGGYQPIALGSVWYHVHANSLVGFQAVIEQGLSATIWPAVAWVLGLPAWLVLGVLGGLLFFTGRSRGRGFD